MAKRVQKKIKYWKTPVSPVWDDQQNLYRIKFEGGRGKVHQELSGTFTSKRLAQIQIDNFLRKHQVEYID